MSLPSSAYIVAEQERAEVRPRAFRIGPTDDDEFLTIEAFGLAPEAPIARRVSAVDRLGDDALESELAGVPPDHLAVARLVIVELKAGNAGDERLQKRFALDERQARGVQAVKMQAIEGKVDERHAALAVARRLRLRKARQSVRADPTRFPVEIGALCPHLRERGHGARIFRAPVETCLPVRVSNCTRPSSMRADMRKPSSLIS